MDKGVMYDACPNYILCTGVARQDRTLCGRCWVFGGRIFFISSDGENLTCYVCSDSEEKCIKYTCSALHGVCISCFKDILSKVKTLNQLSACTICRIVAPKSQPDNPNEPEVRLGQPDGILIRDGIRMPTRDEVALGWLPDVPILDDPMLYQVDDAQMAARFTRLS